MVGVLVGAIALMCSGVAVGQTQVPNDFTAGQPARAAEVNANFDALETAIDQDISEIAALQDQVDSLQVLVDELVGASQGFAVYETDTSGEIVIFQDAVVLGISMSDNIAYGMIKVTRTIEQDQVWVPGVIAAVNNAISPTWQGLEDMTYGVAGWPAGSGCVGDPTSVVVRTNNTDSTSAFMLRPPFGNRVFDPRTGIVWRGLSGGSVNDGAQYDVYEYGLERGWFPNDTGCRTITVGDSAFPEYPGNGKTLVIGDVENWASVPYTYGSAGYFAPDIFIWAKNYPF